MLTRMAHIRCSKKADDGLKNNKWTSKSLIVPRHNERATTSWRPSSKFYHWEDRILFTCFLFSTSLASFPHPHMMKLISNLYPWHNTWQAFQNFPRLEPHVRCGDSEFIILVGLLSSLRNELGSRFSWFVSRLKSGSFLVSYSLPGLIKHIDNTQITFWTHNDLGAWWLALPFVSPKPWFYLSPGDHTSAGAV